MSRKSPTGFVFSVAAEVIAVVFIVSVLPRVDLRRTAGAAPTQDESASPPNKAPASLPLPELQSTRATSAGPTQSRPRETSLYERYAPASLPPPASYSRPPRQPPPLMEVDPGLPELHPEEVEQRLDRASQSLVNTVGTYVSQAASNLLPPEPSAHVQPRTAQPPADTFVTAPQPSIAPTSSQPIASPPLTTPPFATPPALPRTSSGSFATDAPPPPHTHPIPSSSRPRPWMRY